MDSFIQGTLAGGGTFRCESCGFAVALHERDLVPSCPRCESTSFTRSSLFGELGQAEALHPPDPKSPSWLARVRAEVAAPWPHLAWEEDGGGVLTLALEGEWTRVGRSRACDAVFDDPTVSRRHALLRATAEGVRVMDDRSLNGVFVNGVRVDQHELDDGDELAIGRFDLYYLAAAGGSARGEVEHPASPPARAGDLA